MISVFDVLFLAGIVLVLLYIYMSWNFSYWKKRGISFDPKPSVIFGSMTDSFMLRKSIGEIYTSLYRQFPGEKVVGWFKFREPGILIRDPELIHRILVTDFHSFRNNDVFLDPEVDPIMGRNLFVLRDELWKRNRALITPAFTAGRIKAIFPMMNEIGKDLVQFLKEHPEELHVKPTMARYTSEITARCAFGIIGNNLKDSKPEMHELGKLIFEPDFYKNLKMTSFFAMPKLTKLLRMKLVPQKVINFFDGVLNDIIVFRQENKVERNDFIQYLLEVKNKTIEVAKGERESDLITQVHTNDDVLSGCVMFFVESYETSSLVISNVLYQLALHKNVQEKVRKEIDEVLKEGELTFDKLQEMNYLNCVYLETHRILPVMYQMQKVCTEKYELDIGKEKPLVIDKGTPVTIPVYAIHNDPAHWEDPDVFKPERFLNKEEATAKSKGIYLPFGDGPRMCPGMRIASTIVKLAIVNILANLEILPTSKTPQKIQQDPNYFMVYHKGGIYLRFAERSR